MAGGHEDDVRGQAGHLRLQQQPHPVHLQGRRPHSGQWSYSPTRHVKFIRRQLTSSDNSYQTTDLFHYAPPQYHSLHYVPLGKKNVCGSFIFISYWLISHAILSINCSRHHYRHFLLALIIKIPTQPIRSVVK